MSIRVIITGATGMVGEGVLHECLHHHEVEKILVINRRSCEVSHPKLKEIIHGNFFDIETLSQELEGYDACFFCLGVTSIGKKEEEYFRLTYTLTMHAAEMLARLNPAMVFCYISGAGTDSTEKGRSMWARVKGKTENDLMKLPFKRVYAFRPAFLYPTRGLKNAHGFYAVFTLLYPALRRLIPGYVSTLKELGLAMINVVTVGYDKPVLEVKDIVRLAWPG
jgi:nucleoside-diphosphate-sugar epimerase